MQPSRQVTSMRSVDNDTFMDWGAKEEGLSHVVRGMAPWRVHQEGAKQRLVVDAAPEFELTASLEKQVARNWRSRTSYRGNLYDSVHQASVRATPDLRHVAYLAQDEGRAFVVVDHREEPSFPNIASDTIRLSNDGSRVAYLVGRSGEGFWVVDGRKLPESTHLRELAFSPDGKQLAYHVTPPEGVTRIYVDDNLIETYKMAGIRHLTWLPNGQGLAYVLLRPKNEVRAVVNGKLGPTFEEIKWNYPGRDQVFFFSPDSQRVSYVGRRHGKEILVVDHEPFEPLEQATVWNMKFDSDGHHWAAVAGVAYREQFVIVDGRATKPRGHVIFESITFSPDGQHLAYMTSIEDGWTVVVDDTPGQIFEGLSSAGRPPLRWIGPGQFQYGARRAGEWLLVEESVGGSAADAAQ